MTVRATAPRGGRPGPGDLQRAYGLSIPDVVADDLDVLFCGINPSLWSGWSGHHFARPGNRFWPALHRSGFTPRLLDPAEGRELLGYGIGVTNLVARATARADELTDAELVAGGDRLRATVRRHRPGWLAVVGVTAYRVAFRERTARIGPQPERLEADPPGAEPAGARLWVLPNPSGLNAHYDVDGLAAEFARLREAAGLPARVTHS